LMQQRLHRAKAGAHLSNTKFRRCSYMNRITRATVLRSR
jgi:hypothetical protein